jgi:hypothetical protein
VSGFVDWLREGGEMPITISYGLRFLTLDTNSVTRVDFSDPQATLGAQPASGDDLALEIPSNVQSSELRIERAV